MLDSKRVHSPAIFRFENDAKGGRAKALAVRYGVRKKLGRVGRESAWNAKQKVCRASTGIEISQMRRSFETRLVQLGAMPNLVDGVCINLAAVWTGSLGMQRKLAESGGRDAPAGMHKFDAFSSVFRKLGQDTAVGKGIEGHI